MIVCSCNVLSDAQVRSVITSAAPRPRMSYVYASLGCAAECGRCAQTIKVILEEIRSLGTNESVEWKPLNHALHGGDTTRENRMPRLNYCACEFAADRRQA